jgi:hypothetical protein
MLVTFRDTSQSSDVTVESSLAKNKKSMLVTSETSVLISPNLAATSGSLLIKDATLCMFPVRELLWVLQGKTKTTRVQNRTTEQK